MPTALSYFTMLWKVFILVMSLVGLGIYFLFADEELTGETREWLQPVPLQQDNGKGLALLKTLKTIPEHLEARLPGPDCCGRKFWSEDACLIPGKQCLSFIHKNPDVAVRAVPDNPRYLDTIDALMSETPLVSDVDNNAFPDYPRLFDGTKAIFVRDIVRHGGIRPLTMINSVGNQRRLLAQSNTLIGKMVFNATVGISAGWMNMAMGADHPLATEIRHDSRLDGLLKPLSAEEFGFSRAFRFELQYFQKQLENEQPWGGWSWLLVNKKNTLTNRQYRLFKSLTERSLLPWESFWREGEIEYGGKTWTDFISDIRVVLPTYEQYLYSTRFLDAQFAVLRALRRVYQGASPDDHGEPALPLWRWVWKENEGQLCLVAGDIHPDHEDYFGEACLENFMF